MEQQAGVVWTGAHALLAALEERGIRHLFGVPGHGAYPIYNALCDFPRLQPVVGRHEQSSLFGALAYAWTSGSVAAATSVPEAGLTNAATSLLEATFAQDRLLFLLEESPLHRDILRVVAKHYERAADPAEMVLQAHALLDQLETGRPGAAVLEIPSRVLTARCARDLPPRPPSPTPASPPDQIADAANVLARAARVVILAGATAAAAQAGPVVQRLAERLNAPVFVDGFAKGLVPEDHPLALGRAWTPTGPGERLLQEADAVLVIGAPQAAGQSAATWDPKMVVGSRPPELLARQLVLIDWDDQDHRPLPARVRLYGHVPSILRALAEALGPGAPGHPTPPPGYPPEQLAAVRRFLWEYAARRVPWAVPFFQALQAALPRDVILLLDSMVGLWVDRLVPALAPCSVRFPFGTGTLGFGIPAAVGAKLAHPDREVVVVAGDGAFLYNPQELATLLLYGQKVTLVVANDNCYGAIKHNMTETFGRAIAYELKNPDFVRLAEAFGMRGIRLAAPDDLAPALSAAIHGSGSTLIEVPLELRPPRQFYA